MKHDLPQTSTACATSKPFDYISAFVRIPITFFYIKREPYIAIWRCHLVLTSMHKRELDGVYCDDMKGGWSLILVYPFVWTDMLLLIVRDYLTNN